MPVVELSYLRLGKLVGAGKKKISDVLPFLGLDIEHEDKDTVKVEYSPNRPDYSTDFGIALGLQGILGIKTGAPKLRIKRSRRFAIRATPDVSKVRPFVTGIAAVNGRLDDHTIRQIVAMQEDLHFGIGKKRAKSSIGIHDLDKMTFPLKYTTAGKDYKFTPLNSQKELSLGEILNTTDTGRDYGGILTGHSKMPVIIDSQGKTVSFPPIINATATTITARTRNLLVEITGINKADIEDTLSVVATILQSAGFSLVQVDISGLKNSAPKFEPKKIALAPGLVNSTLGLNLSPSRIVSSLKRSRIGAAARTRDILCEIPPYRFDIFGPMDLVEEAALGYGIDKLRPTLAPSQTIGMPSPVSASLKMLDKTMVGLGYLEALSSTLTSRRVLYDMVKRQGTDAISVLDSKSQEHTILRDSILPGLLDGLSRNIHEQYPQRIFETGWIFSSPAEERLNFAAASAHQEANFTEIKSILQSALKTGFNMDAGTRTAHDNAFEKGHCAAVVLDGADIGMIGQIDSQIIQDYKIRVPVVGFEISLSGSVLK